MKGTDLFREQIEKGLRMQAFTDPQLAEALKKPHKNIDGCIDYILQTVQKSKLVGFSDDEVFSMAKHYFFEDDLKVNKFQGQYQVVSNVAAKLTEKEIEELKEKARQEVIEQEKQRMLGKNKKPKQKTEAKPGSDTLF